jgi:GNAT superfamily N-acetyltransferase
MVDCPMGGRLSLVWCSIEGSMFHLQMGVRDNIAAAALAEAALTLCSINGQLTLPGFSLDTTTGELRYRVSVPLPDEGLSAGMVEDLLVTCLETANHYDTAFPPDEAKVSAEDGTHASSRSVAAPSGRSFTSIPVRAETPQASSSAVSGTRESIRDEASGVVWAPATEEILADAYWQENELLLVPRASDEPLRNDRAIAWMSDKLDDIGALAATSLRLAPQPLIAALENLGFEELYEELFVSRSLLDLDALPSDPGTWYQPEAFPSELLLQCVDGLRNGLTPLDAIVQRLSGTPLPFVRVCDQEGAPAALTLFGQGEPQNVGTVIFFGLVPSLRGHGRGTTLHAAALRELRSLGFTEYSDATFANNRATMLIFFRNGCSVRTVLQHRLARAATA